MNRLKNRLVCLLLVSTMCCAQQVRLIEVGSFHGSDVHARSGIGWLGLYCDGARCFWKSTAIRATRSHDDVVDEDSDKNTGIDISVASKQSPVFLIRGLDLSRFKIVQAFHGEQNMIGGDEFALGLEGRKYKLILRPKGTEEDPIPKGATLTLVGPEGKQIIFSLPQGGNDPHITVLWAGDLDGDGKLDLYINMSDHYNVSNKVLLLSSRAKSGQLVGVVGRLLTTGC